MVKNAYCNLPRLFEKAASNGKAFWNNSLISYWTVTRWMAVVKLFKGVLLCSLTVLILFWECTRTCSRPWWLKKRIICHIIYIIIIPFSQPDTNGFINPGFDEGPHSEKRNVLWLVSCLSALWLANSLGGFNIGACSPIKILIFLT